MKGYTPNTILYDVVTNFSSDPDDPYEPHNYDNEERGPVTIRKALAGSLNIPAVKALYLAGVNNVLDLAQELGYSTFAQRDRFGLSLVLGGGEVKLIEHTNAYAAFAREGVIHPLSALLRVEDKDGKVLEEFEAKDKKVIDPKYARLVNDVLSDNTARSYVFGESNWLTLGDRPVAAKTGTTNDYRDAWTMGYTPSLVTGVWVGNNDNSEMKRGAAGGVVAAPIWHDYMSRVLGDTPVEYFKKPDIPQTGKPILDGEAGAPQIVKIDKATGLLATEFTPPEMIEEMTYYEPHSILYYIDRNDPLGDAPSDPENDPQFDLWESRVLEWADKQTATSSDLTVEKPPTEYDDVHKPENIPTIKLVSPDYNQTLMNPRLNVIIQTSSIRGVKRAEYYIDGHLLTTNDVYPFNLSADISFLSNGFHNLKIRACDDVNNCAVESLEFNLALEEQSPPPEPIVSWSAPSSGLALNKIDFPLALSVNIDRPERVSGVSFYAQKEGDESPTPIDTIEPVEQNDITGHWGKIPAGGTYSLTARITTWDKKTITAGPITLIVNNDAPGPPSGNDQ